MQTSLSSYCECLLLLNLRLCLFIVVIFLYLCLCVLQKSLRANIGRGANIRRVAPTFSIESWNVYSRILSELPITNNCVEGVHNALQSSFTNKHPNLWKLVEGLKREVSSAKEKLADLEHGEGTYRKKKYKDSFKKKITL